MKRLLNILNCFVTFTLVLLIVAISFVTFSARFSRDKIPTVKNHKLLTVLSGSMEPQIHTGDVIIIAPLKKGEIAAEGDVITFRTKEKQDMLITHRVVGIVKINGKPTAYVTKGDANKSKDLATVSIDQVVGRHKWSIPYFGYITNFVRKPLGIVLCVILPGAILIGVEFARIWRLLGEAEASKAASAAANCIQGGGDTKSN